MCLIQFIEGLGRTKGLARENLLSLPGGLQTEDHHQSCHLTQTRTYAIISPGLLAYHGIPCTLSIIV